MPLSVASRLLPLRTMYSRLSSTSMMAARVAGVPRPVSFMASESSFSSSVLPAVSMAVSSVPSVKRLGGARLLLQDLDVQHVLRLALGEPRRQLLFARRIAGAGRGFLRLRRRHVQHLPADLLHRAARGVIAVHDGVIANRGDHGGDAPDVVVVPGAEQAAADQVVDLALFGRERGLAGARWRWE